jgi:DNA-binding NarL/FixJ family response regulator
MAPNTSRGPVGGAAATDAPAAVVRLVVADAHRLMQDAVAAQLEPERFEIVGRARTGSEALALVARTSPDAVLTESDLPDLDGVALVTALRRRFPGVVAVVFAEDTRAARVQQALDAGAHAYISKAIDPRCLGRELRRALGERTPIAIGVPEPLGAEKLTPRQLSILRLVAQGRSNVEIGQRERVAERTVKFHLTNIYRKIGVANRTEAALFARLHGLLDDAERHVA